MKSSLRNKFKGQKCLVCFNTEFDLAHVKSRGAHGPDEEWNLMPLCRFHHGEQHARGIITFISTYPRVRKYLETKGWKLVELVGKLTLVHPELEAHYECSGN
jgi:5-methylcytosine-specific restriction endonuclease McrA